MSGVKHNCQIPDDALVVGVVELVTYVTAAGTQGATYRRAGDGTYSEVIGWLEWVKHNLITDWEKDWPDVDNLDGS